MIGIWTAVASGASGQGILIDQAGGLAHRLPRPWPIPQPIISPPIVEARRYRVAALEVDAQLDDAKAQVQVAQTFENTGHQTLEATFVFPLPYDGAIDSMTLLVDGKEYPAQLLSRDEARRRYEEIVRSSRDPALLEWVGSGMFQTSVFPIPPGAKRVVSLRYTQALRSSQGLTDFLFPLSAARYSAAPLETLRVRVAIASASSLGNVYSPSHVVSVERADARHAIAAYSSQSVVPDADFRLFFARQEGVAAASVVSYRPNADDAGYFLLLASPQMEEKVSPAPKTVVFVVDRSGSMSGEKMEQARGAVQFVLNNLREGDLFNIVAYDSEIQLFRPELQKFDETTRTAALGFVQGLYAGGSTNIDGALTSALGMVVDPNRPSYVLFLTDGLPTAGETSEGGIVKRVEAARKVRARIFSFGVGYDVNSRLLDRLSRDNYGASHYVRPNENIEGAVSGLYRRIGAPVITDVELSLDVEGAATVDGPTVSRVYPRGKWDLFAGDQAIIVGRYARSGAAKGRLRGRQGDVERTIDFPCQLAEAGQGVENAFVARLWGMRRVGEIIDQLDLEGQNAELIQELVELAKRHGILTPYTSFMADDSVNLSDGARLSSRARRETDSLSAAEGRFAFNARADKAEFKSAALPAQQPADLARALAREAQTADDRKLVLAQLARSGGRGSSWFDVQEGRQRSTPSVFVLGGKTFFRRADAWVDSEAIDDRAASPQGDSPQGDVPERDVQEIVPFSDAYFALVDAHGAHVADYLSLEGTVIVRLGKTTYRWTSPAP